MTVNHKEYDIGNGKTVIAYYDDKGITEIYKEAFEKYVIPALRKVEKYKYHDLRKNPNDLPTEHKVLACCQDGCLKYYETVHYGKPCVLHPSLNKKCFYGSDLDGDYVLDNVIGWAYIPPFESEDE